MVGVHAVGAALDDVVRAFVLLDLRFEGWLVEQAGEFAQLSSRAKATQVRKLDEQIGVVEKDLLAARTQEALVQIEREFATSSPEAA